jgi:tripeptidyl-peptidase-1
MVVLNLAVVTALAALSSAAPFTIKHVVHEERVKPPSEWIKTSRIESSAILPIRIGLTQSNLHKGPEYLGMFVNGCPVEVC